MIGTGNEPNLPFWMDDPADFYGSVNSPAIKAIENVSVGLIVAYRIRLLKK